MYHFESRVRYSEVDCSGRLALTSVVDYLQNCCVLQSEDLNIGVDYLKWNHEAWVLTAWEIVIVRSPLLGESLTVSMWPYHFKGFVGYRNFTIKDASGEICAFANSDWIHMDADSMRPKRIPKEVIDIYVPEMAEPIDYPWTDRKIKVTGEPMEKEPVCVQRFHLDTNRHMNNSKYILVAAEYLPEDFVTETLKVEYKKPAKLGDILYPKVYKQEKEITVTLADEKEMPYAIIKFVRKNRC